VIKPVDLYQGKCLKICGTAEKINRKIKKFFQGIDLSYKDSEDEIDKQDKVEKVEKVDKVKLGEKSNIKPDIVNNVNNANKPMIENNTDTPGDKPQVPEKPEKQIEFTIDEIIKENKKSNQNNIKQHNTKKYLSSCVVLQKYVESPFLYKNRKFDMRIFVLVSHSNEVYIFKEGHLKTCSLNYDVDSKNPFIHITNYSVQKHSKMFETFEFGNEVSYKDFENFLTETGSELSLKKHIIPKIKGIIEITLKSVREKLNKQDTNFCFEIYGYDFILDQNLRPWLLEINDNPGLCNSSPLIGKLIPRMLDDAFRITLDVIFNTKYSEETYINDKYVSRFKIEDYDDDENLWDYICKLEKGENKKYDKLNLDFWK